MFTHQELLKETTSLSKFAAKLTRNRDDADDLLQQTILTALNKQEQFEQGTNLFSWMSRIMFNTFVSGYRHSSRFETQYDPQIYIDQETVEASQENETELSLVGAAMMALTEDHREILRMVCIEGMRYAEVAAELQIPVGTVRSRLSRAREGLQEQLTFSRSSRKIPSRIVEEMEMDTQGIEIRNEGSLIQTPDFANAVAANQDNATDLPHRSGFRV